MENGTLERNQAEVVTASANIRICRIGPKQMTLAVFRQLPVRAVAGENLYEPVLQGNPWGSVNYFWKDCKQGLDWPDVLLPSNLNSYYETNHLHVIWELDGVLYRDCLPSRDGIYDMQDKYLLKLESLIDSLDESRCLPPSFVKQQRDFIETIEDFWLPRLRELRDGMLPFLYEQIVPLGQLYIAV